MCIYNYILIYYTIVPALMFISNSNEILTFIKRSLTNKRFCEWRIRILNFISGTIPMKNSKYLNIHVIQDHTTQNVR